MYRDKVVHACRAIYGGDVDVRIDVSRMRRKVITAVTCNGHRLAVRGVGQGVVSSMRNLLTIIIVSSVHILEFERVRGTRYVDRKALRSIVRSTDHLSSAFLIVGDPE